VTGGLQPLASCNPLASFQNHSPNIIKTNYSNSKKGVFTIVYDCLLFSIILITSL
jgi:hypothetical protein